MPHELVMPYVTVASRGGPHDDDAFVAGMVCGHLDAHMVTIAALRAELTVFVPRDVLPQVDLIAMRHRYVALQVEGDPLAPLVEVRLRPEPCSPDTSRG